VPGFSGLAGRVDGAVEAAVVADWYENTELAVEGLEIVEAADDGRDPPVDDSGVGVQRAGMGVGAQSEGTGVGDGCETSGWVGPGREGTDAIGVGVAIPNTADIGCASSGMGPCRVGCIGCGAVCKVKGVCGRSWAAASASSLSNRTSRC